MSKKLPITMDKEDFYKIIKITIQPHHKIAFLLGFESGLRISEVLKLTIDKFNFKEGTIRIEGGKGDKDRIVPIPQHWNENLNGYLPIGISKRALQNAFEMYSARCGVRTKIRNVHFHTLRHGFATELLRAGCPLNHIQMLLGHTDISTTMVYANLTPMESIQAYNKYWGST